MNDIFTPPFEIIEQHVQSSSQIEDYWHNLLNSPNVNTTGKKAVVYVLDSCEEFVADDLPKTGNQWKYNATGRTGDLGNHGHMVASMISSLDNNFGSKGIATGAIVIPVKALHINSGAWSWAIEGLDYIIQNYNENFKDTHIGIINMSFGGSQPYEPLKNKLQECINNGLVPVAAAGNGGGQIDYPGAWDDVCITATAIDRNLNPASFTDRGQAADVSAPGVAVVTVMPNNTYPRANGTSFSSPLVAGVICHIAEAKFNELIGKGAQTFKLIHDHIKNFATDFGQPGEDELGAGYTKIKPYLDNEFTDSPDEEEPDYPKKESRVVTLEFEEGWKVRWGTSFSFTKELDMAEGAMTMNSDLIDSNSGWMYIDRMVLDLQTDKLVEEEYNQALTKLNKHLERRGYVLHGFPDINDVAYWVYRFMNILVDLDFKGCQMHVSDDKGTKVIWNDTDS